MPRSVEQWQADVDKVDETLSALAGEGKVSITIGDVTYTRSDTDKLIKLRQYYAEQLSSAKRRKGKGDKFVWGG